MRAKDQELVSLMRETLPPPSEPPPSVDLWPQLQLRLTDPRTSVGKLDWLMAALVMGLLAGFPETVMLVLYHL